MSSSTVHNRRITRAVVEPIFNGPKVSAKSSPNYFIATAAVSITALVLFFSSPERYDFPAALLCILIFNVVPLVLKGCRINVAIPLCPANMAQLIFGIQLIVLPLLGMLTEFSRGSLPSLPSNFAINVALLINATAYLSFSVAYDHSVRTFSERNGHRESQSKTLAREAKNVFPLIPIFLVVGLIGYYLFYGSLSGLVQYFSDPSQLRLKNEELAGTFGGAASTFLRPFLSISVVMWWSLVIDRFSGDSNARVKVTSSTILTIFTILLVNVSYSRFNMLGPMFAITAVYSLKVRRISIQLLAVGGVAVLVLSFIWGDYRGSQNTSIEDLTNATGLSRITRKADINSTIQMYGSAPQFLAYLVEGTAYGTAPDFGTSLFSSLLYPVPILGKAFREYSTVNRYNLLIYERTDIVDQVVPSQGELFINFHIVGVIGGFALLGYVTAKLQERFARASTSFEAFNWFVISIWLSFLIIGSTAVISQVFVYTLWPFYVYKIWNRLSLIAV